MLSGYLCEQNGIVATNPTNDSKYENDQILNTSLNMQFISFSQDFSHCEDSKVESASLSCQQIDVHFKENSISAM